MLETLPYEAEVEDGFRPVETVAGDPACGLLLLCDHASNALPERYGTLGLPPSELERHIGYDIGARSLAMALAARLNAPLVMTRFSRLLIDPNRGLDDPTILMRLSDGAVIPGNAKADMIEKARRIRLYYEPYDRIITSAIDAGISAGRPPALFSIHSYTANWRGWPRPWHGGILWDKDPRLALPVLEMLREEHGLIIGDNEPYSGALSGDTLYRHATLRGLPQALLEVRQDLIADSAGVEAWADRVEPVLRRCLTLPGLNEIALHGSHGDPAAA